MKLSSSLSRVLTMVLANKPHFRTKDVQIGKNVRFGRNVVFNCKHVRIGDGVHFQDNIIVNSDIFQIGDYGTVYQNCFFPGPGKLCIGHNFWLGASSIVDSQGGTIIGNNVGIGPHSQLWSHMFYGDVMYGCRFHGVKPLVIEDDVWLVGHCLVLPVTIGRQSLAMLGSLITKDMISNRTYAGSPAQEITEKIGPQFKVTSVKERVIYLQKRFQDFAMREKVGSTDGFARIVTLPSEMPETDQNITIFNVADRTYTKRGSQIEYKLIRFLLPDAKFIPLEPNR